MHETSIKTKFKLKKELCIVTFFHLFLKSSPKSKQNIEIQNYVSPVQLLLYFFRYVEMSINDVLFYRTMWNPRILIHIWTPFPNKPNIKQNDTKPRKKIHFAVYKIYFYIFIQLWSEQQKKTVLLKLTFWEYNEHLIWMTIAADADDNIN
jgi:hypothetical protein